MPQKTLLDFLMRRDNLTLMEARELINDIRRRIAEGEDPEELLFEELGLEPDHIFDLL